MTGKKIEKLNADLDSVIGKMKKIQRKIAADAQPASMPELDALTKLGNKYAKIVKKLAKAGAQLSS